MCAAAELGSVRCLLKTNQARLLFRRRVWRYGLSQPFPRGLNSEGGGIGVVFSKLELVGEQLPRKTFTFSQRRERAVAPREAGWRRGRSRDRGLQRYVLKGVDSSGHRRSSPPRAAAHLCHVVNLHHHRLLLFSFGRPSKPQPTLPIALPEVTRRAPRMRPRGRSPALFISQARVYKTIII